MSWQNLHTGAINAKTPREFIAVLDKTQANLDCEKCVAHYKAFRAANQITNADYFAYTWRLHDDVNKLLKKTSMPLEEARAYYTKLAKAPSIAVLFIALASSYITDWNSPAAPVAGGRPSCGCRS